jgi:hypothetical protein
VLDSDHQARLQLSREHAAELAREYRRAQKLQSASADARPERSTRRPLRLAWLRRTAKQASVQA